MERAKYTEEDAPGMHSDPDAFFATRQDGIRYAITPKGFTLVRSHCRLRGKYQHCGQSEKN